jgi:hypothetical protein
LLDRIDTSGIPPFVAGAVYIYESILRSTGVEYKKLKSFALRGDKDRRKE